MMKKFLKKVINPYFALGVDVTLLITVFADFLDGRSSTKFTIVIGTIVILLIGLNLMEIEALRQKKKENE